MTTNMNLLKRLDIRCALFSKYINIMTTKTSQQPAMATVSHLRPLGIAAVVIASLAVTSPYIFSLITPHLGILSAHSPVTQSNQIITPQQEQQNQRLAPFVCEPHSYTTEIVSLDPLLIYIRSFLSPAETAALLDAGESAFRPSEVYKSGRRQGTTDRTSSSAGLPRDDAAVRCVLARAEEFMGNMLDGGRGDDIGPPQLVRYVAGQRFNTHHDWYSTPRPARNEDRWRGSSWNRIASFFSILQDGCEGGETWFPYVNVSDKASPDTAPKDDGEGKEREQVKRQPATWRKHEDSGIAFAPVSGNALFWVNLFPNGTGDTRTIHAGLPVKSGLKTAMNIWPRKYYD